MIVLLPFPSWQQLVGFVTSATVLSFGAGTLVVGALRRELPDRERPFRAMRMRLPRARVEANIEHTKAEVEAEESDLAAGH